MTDKKRPNLVFEVEHTDTFGGEANYSWVRRYEMTVPAGTSDLGLIRRAKKVAGMSGVRSVTENYGDQLAIEFTNVCHVIFVTFSHEENNSHVVEYLKEIATMLAEVEFCMDERGEYMPDAIKAKVAPHLKTILSLQEKFDKLIDDLGGTDD